MPISAINPYLVDRLLPQSKPIKNINDMINRNRLVNPATALINDTLTFVNELQSAYTAMRSGVSVNQEDSGLDYAKYITPNNPKVTQLARSIVNYSDSNDTKMFKVEQWVQEHIQYVTDIQNYGQMERWAYPVETLNRKSGDCEDQAFLIHSLGIAAGVPPDRLRTYGGIVFNPDGYFPSGHGWTAYRRESDNQWVNIDSTYYPISTPISERTPTSKDIRYIDDFWYIQSGKTTDTPYANKIRYAGISKGTYLDVMA